MQISVLKILYFLAWLIFVGIGIEAGGYIVGTLRTLYNGSADGVFQWGGVDLAGLFAFDKGYFYVITANICIVAILKATLFYQIIHLLHDKKLNMAQPFNASVLRFIFIFAYMAVLIGAMSAIGSSNVVWMVENKVTMPSVEKLGLAGADVWLFMAVVLYVIAQIFKRGIEIQSENELTV